MELRSKTKLYFPGYIINFTTFLEAILVTFSADALKLQLKTKEVFQTLILFLLVNFFQNGFENRIRRMKN